MNIFPRTPGSCLLLLATALLLAACGQEQAPTPLPLMNLHAQAALFDGRLVVTSGVVRRHDEPEHYWIEDAELRRVALEPMEQALPHLGKQVRVTGTFRHSTESGRRILIQQIEPLD